MPLSMSEMNAIQKLVGSEFSGRFSAQKTNYQKFTSEKNDTEYLTVWEFLAQLPKFREWVGARQAKALQNYSYTIQKKDWELTISIPHYKLWNASKTELASQVKKMVGDLGAQFRRDYPSDLVLDAVEDGTSNLAYDGYAFFEDGTSRKDYNGDAQSNLLTGSGTDEDDIITDIQTARTTMRKYKDEEGRPQNILGNIALIPPELEYKFRKILNATELDNDTNTLKGLMSYIVDARLSDANDWYLLAGAEFVKPILYVAVGDVNVAVKDNTFEDKGVLVGADATGNVGYSFPELAIKVVNA